MSNMKNNLDPKALVINELVKLILMAEVYSVDRKCWYCGCYTGRDHKKDCRVGVALREAKEALEE